MHNNRALTQTPCERPSSESGRGEVRYSTSAIISISTGTCRGSEFVPTAERAWMPLLPNTCKGSGAHMDMNQDAGMRIA